MDPKNTTQKDERPGDPAGIFGGNTAEQNADMIDAIRVQRPGSDPQPQTAAAPRSD
jgi:hypothetical protein